MPKSFKEFDVELECFSYREDGQDASLHVRLGRCGLSRIEGFQ